MRNLAVFLVFSCGASSLDRPTTPAPIDDSFPLTRGEEQGQTYLADPIVARSRACRGKSPIELRLYTTDIGRVTVRAAAKNCTKGELRFLHDAHLQPSELAVVQNGKSIAPSDERAIEKFDRTIHAAAFTTLAPDEERVLEESYFVLDNNYSFRWLPFHYAVTRGKCRISARFRSVFAEGDAEGRRTKIEHAWIGTVESNAIDVTLP